MIYAGQQASVRLHQLSGRPYDESKGYELGWLLTNMPQTVRHPDYASRNLTIRSDGAGRYRVFYGVENREPRRASVNLANALANLWADVLQSTENLKARR